MGLFEAYDDHGIEHRKTPLACLAILVEKILDIQTLLHRKYGNELILKNKLYDAVKDVKAFQLAYYKSSGTVQRVFTDRLS